MHQTTRNWLPVYCHPESLLPTVQETITLFSHPPYLFQDFVGQALAFLRSDVARKMGFAYDPATALPCKWKCADESVFGVDLILHAYTGHYPFDKGRIGGCFNEGSLGAAVHHSTTNIDFGGSHVGYLPGEGHGRFGQIVRPLREGQAESTDCGYLMAVLAPFKLIYDDACANIVLFAPEPGLPLVSIPNEFLQPSWSRQPVKLLVDVERLTRGTVPYDVSKPHTHKLAGRTLFYVAPDFLDGLAEEKRAQFSSPEWTPIGRELVAELFNIYDDAAELVQGVPSQRLLPYIKYILSSKVAPYPLKAAVTNANIEHNTLVDSIRAEALRSCSFASFSGVFIDLYDHALGAYVNLFQPVGAAIKPAGRTREIELAPAELHEIFAALAPVEPVLPLRGVLGYERPAHLLERFTYGPAVAAR